VTRQSETPKPSGKGFSVKETEKKPTRSARRYVLALPVQLARGSGLTRDVSAGGVYFLTDQVYPLDSQVDLTLVFGATLPESPMQVQCHARVVRVEPHSDGVGIAAAITSLSFA